MAATAYGITWAVSLLHSLGILAWSHFAVFPSPVRMTAAMTSRDTAAMRRGMALILVEVAGFFLILTCMILMRFGLEGFIPRVRRPVG